jgi:autotransporter-associated beta strand protein
VNLQGNTHVFDVAEGGAAIDLDVTADLANGSLTKAGEGTIRLSGSSTFNGGVNLNQGKLLVKTPSAVGTGPVTIASAATLGIEINGGTPIIYDRLNVLDHLTLGGALSVDLLNGFAPAVGDTFDILDWSTLTGTFNVIQLPPLAAGLEWNTSELYTTGVLSVVSAGPAGDYNDNGAVDAADYILWRNNVGSGTSLANDETPGVGQDDYNRWRSHFGQSAGGGAALPSAESLSAAVPEPSIVMQLIVAAAGAYIRRYTARGRRHQIDDCRSLRSFERLRR